MLRMLKRAHSVESTRWLITIHAIPLSGCTCDCSSWELISTYEDNGGRKLLSNPEKLPHKARPIAQVFLDELRAHHPQEGSAGLVRHRLGKERLACAWLPIEDHTLPRT